MARWWLSWALGTFTTSMLVYYLLFHLLIAIPLRSLYAPFTIQVLLTILIGPVMFDAIRRFKSSGGRDIGMFYVGFTLLSFCTAMCWTYFGVRIHVIPRDHVAALYIIVIAGSVLGPGAAYFLRKIARKSR